VFDEDPREVLAPEWTLTAAELERFAGAVEDLAATVGGALGEELAKLGRDPERVERHEQLVDAIEGARVTPEAFLYPIDDVSGEITLFPDSVRMRRTVGALAGGTAYLFVPVSGVARHCFPALGVLDSGQGRVSHGRHRVINGHRAQYLGFLHLLDGERANLGFAREEVEDRRTLEAVARIDVQDAIGLGALAAQQVRHACTTPVGPLPRGQSEPLVGLPDRKLVRDQPRVPVGGVQERDAHVLPF